MEKFLKLPSAGKVGERRPQPIELRCPKCRQTGTFEELRYGANQGTPLNDVLDFTDKNVVMGSRRCPNRKCSTHVFVVLKYGSQGPEVVRSFPAERIDFDDSSIPEEISGDVRRGDYLNWTIAHSQIAVD